VYENLWWKPACQATLSTLKRELGTRAMLTIAALTVVSALVSALLLHGVTSIM
jgi:Fe2+ transport system protein B